MFVAFLLRREADARPARDTVLARTPDGWAARTRQDGLLFPEGPREVIGEWLRQVREHRPVACLDEALDGHTRQKLCGTEALALSLRDSDPDRIMRHSAALVRYEIGGNARDVTFDLRR